VQLIGLESSNFTAAYRPNDAATKLFGLSIVTIALLLNGYTLYCRAMKAKA
jgi:hypothetical protein